jgi:predicted flap endonuclease-1-like 5' DNA nuclease
MWFLIFQISLLLILAAILGAALAWWWMKRRYEDVTESHERLIAETSRMERLQQLASREDLKAGIATLTSAVGEIKHTDLEPVFDRLQRIELILAGQKAPDLQSLQSQLNSRFDERLAPIGQRVTDLAALVARQPPPDMKPVEDKISILEQTIRSIRIPAPDLGPVHSGIAALQLAVDRSQSQVKALEPLENRIGAIELAVLQLGERLEAAHNSNREAVTAHLSSVSTAVSALKNTDLDPVAERLTAVEQAIANFHIPATDLRPLHASMIDLERVVMTLDKPPQDLSPLHNRLAALQTSVAGVHSEVRNRDALDTLERRLASLQEAVQTIPEPDLQPIQGAIQTMEARLDLGSLENRLTAIEYGLAALHHTLRTRTEPVSTRTDATWQLRAVPTNSTAKARMPAPPRPPRESDPINAVRRPDDQANLLIDPAFGPPDDLEQIHGVGPMLRELLNDIGVYYFWQVAEWTNDEITFVDNRLLHFKGRIRRDDWIEHARALASSPTAARRPVAWETRA